MAFVDSSGQTGESQIHSSLAFATEPISRAHSWLLLVSNRDSSNLCDASKQLSP